MTEKIVSKHLINLEKHFALTQPILQKAGKIFHELDQIEYDLDLIEADESTARKSSWWPIISFIGGTTPSKNQFMSHYLGSDPHPPAIHVANHKFTVLQYTPQNTEVTLPGTALDVDHRLPFYQISEKIEELVVGESQKINGHLELRTLHSEKLKGKLFIDTPAFASGVMHPVTLLLTQHTLDISDLVFVFTDIFEAQPEVNNALINKLITHQETNKLIYLIERSETELDNIKTNDLIAYWQQRLAQFGLDTGEFIVLPTANSQQEISNIAVIEQLLMTVEYDRSYRVLHSLEKNIRDIDDVILPTVKTALSLWKNRSNITSLIVASLIVAILVFLEVSMGAVDVLIDPILGPIAVVILLALLIGLHVLASKIHAKFIIAELHQQQKSLHLIENLAALFEKSLTFWRIVLPVNEPVGDNRKNRAKLAQLIEKTKELIQSLNDGFSHLEDEGASFYPKSTPTATN